MNITVQVTIKRAFFFLVAIALFFSADAHAISFAMPSADSVKIAKDSAKKATDPVHVKLVKARQAIEHASVTGKKTYGSKQVRVDLADVKKRFAPIKKNLLASDKLINPSTLTGYSVLLKRSQEKLATWRKLLARADSDLEKSAKEIARLKQDSLLNIKKQDSLTNPVYAAQVNQVKLKLKQTDRYIVTNLDTVNRLMSDVSYAYLEIADMQGEISERLKASGGVSSLDKEATYLWSAPRKLNKENIAVNLSSSYEGETKILQDFTNTTWDDRLLDILLGGLFFLWVFLNYKKAKKPDAVKNIGEVNFRHISPLPIVQGVIVVLSLSPLCEANAPSLYIEVIHFLLLIALSVYFWKRLSASELRYWLFTVVIYIVIVVTNAAVHNDIVLRLWLIALNLCSLYFGFVFSRKLLSTEVTAKLIKPVLVIYLALNLLAVIFNIFGRISLAKTMTMTGIIAITQVIALAVFIQIVIDGLELQIKVSACSGGLFSRVDLNKTRASFKKVLSVLAVLIWLLVFIIDLNISKQVFTFVSKLLDNKRVFGSVSFTIGNVLFFSLILYISNLFQKNIGVLFGEKSITFSNQVEHKSSKLTLFRLIIAIIGILLAITASGIPLDKLTVVLGALSVGIGLGMQNIVNNFVSGIILIFEKPFQIGDFVELADKKGKIQDIGIRATKMLTQQGSEVIIPNGDLVSNRFVNWTINSANVRSEIIFKVNAGADLGMVTKIIKEEITKATDSVKSANPEIFINSIAADAVELRILIWINSIYAESSFKSDLLTGLMGRFNDAQVKIM